MEIEFILSVFGVVITTLGTLLLNHFREMKTDVKSMSASINQLNIKLEKVIVDQTWHKEEMTMLKERIDALQKEK